jgi:putative ABC transport system ATP-binding protein
MIALRAVGKTYHSGSVSTEALRSISLDIGQGEHVAIRGPSGSGKTTLLNLVGLLDVPSTGDVLLEGHETRLLSERARAQLRNKLLGFVFQGYNLIPELRAWENVALPGRYGGMRRRERRDLALKVLGRVGLADRVNNRPAQLSGGEEQRVAIARSLLMSPRIVLADEPTGNLDSDTGRAVLDLLDSVIEDGATLVTVTHDDAVACRASRTISLMDGCVVSDVDAREGDAR